jgi:hypothetical protein
MRVKLREALKARRSKAQGGGRAAAETLGWQRKNTSPERAVQSACIALSGLNLNPIRNPGFQSPLRVLFHPGLCCSALSALHLRLTRMPFEGSACFLCQPRVTAASRALPRCAAPERKFHDLAFYFRIFLKICIYCGFIYICCIALAGIHVKLRGTKR